MSKQNISLGRRRSRSLAGFASKDLCETIPKSDSPPERLMLLLEKSFQYALSVAQREVMRKEGFDINSFRKNGTECWQKIRAIIEEQNLDKSAVTEDGLCESYVEAKVEECNEAVALMEAESKKWSDRMSYYREGLQTKIDSSYLINSSEVEKENDLYDYSDIMRHTSELEKEIPYQLHSLSSTEAIIKEHLDLCRNCDSALQKRCEKYYHHKVSSTPRTIIRKIASETNFQPCNAFK